MNVTLRIRKYDPSKDKEPYFRDYLVEVNESDRLLDALVYVKTYVDGSLAFRRSCGHGICGSDAMVINGVERLACKTLVRDALAGGTDNVIRIEPLKALPLERDLIVNQDRFFERYRAVVLYLVNGHEPPGGERLQSPRERERFEDATKCILCAACFSSCPIENLKNPNFLGPAAIVQAARFVFDSRDEGFDERLPALDTPDGVWACENKFNCTRVCPRGIKVTKNINLTKSEITARRKAAP